MKHVFDYSTVAHIWANQLQDDARNAHNNFFFEFETIYSYGRHFPIARHVKNSKGEKAVLFTEQRYSNTTAKHISIVNHAANHLNVIYCYNPHYTNERNFTCWLNQIERIAANLPKAKKPEKYLSEISGVGYHVKKYADFFDIAIPENLQVALSIGNKDEYAAYAGKKEALELAAKERAEAELKKRHKKELAEWLNGKTNRLYTRDGFDYLRISGDKVETSQGVDLTIDYALKVYNRLKNDKLKVGDKVLQYEVIKMNGVVTIGCHNFKKSYLLSFGEKLNNLPVTQP